MSTSVTEYLAALEELQLDPQLQAELAATELSLWPRYRRLARRRHRRSAWTACLGGCLLTLLWSHPLVLAAWVAATVICLAHWFAFELDLDFPVSL